MLFLSIMQCCLLFPRWQQYPWSAIVTTAVLNTSGRWHAAEEARSLNSVSCTALLNWHQNGVWGLMPFTHNALGVWWPSIPAMDGPLYGYLVSRVCVCVCVRGHFSFTLECYYWTFKWVPLVSCTAFHTRLSNPISKCPTICSLTNRCIRCSM